MNAESWGGALVALLALAGTVYTARQARSAGREQITVQSRSDERAEDREAFKEIRDSLQSQINGLREEIGRLRSDVNKLHDDVADREDVIRLALSHIRELNRYIANPIGGVPPALPERLIGWSL
ncbi:hypothetical protein ABZ829_27975 [Streptomyces xanthochromogenes]|uniref:hypothetical protein n=1 Tax=Streptomyces xanthochromogenes TaxID=67384 RepID=UPI00341E356C